MQLSSNQRYLVDSSGSPVLIHADSAWSIMAQLTDADIEVYLEDRRTKGFNAVLLNVIEHGYANNPPKNVYGQGPFTTPGDFATPNAAYFAYFDTLLTKAAEKGIMVFAAPAYRGDSAWDGWEVEIVNNGPVKNRNYGRYLGNRYKSFNNIIWVAWGDQVPKPGSVLEANSLEILKGIKDNAPTHLHTGHFKRDITSREAAAFKPYMDLDALYTSVMPYVEALRRYAVSDPKPTFLYEAYYEGNSGSGQPLGTPSLVRRQAYWAMTSGATGHIYGNHGVWGYGWTGWTIPENKPTWKEDLSDPGTLDMAHVQSLFSGLRWYDLVPDSNATVVTGPRGTKATADPKTNITNPSGYDYVTAARTPDGKLVMAYLPPTGLSARTITVDMTKLSGTANARWFNPNTGAYTTISGSPFPNSGSMNFTSPGNNGDNSNDWILLLEAGSPSGPPPPPAGPHVTLTISPQCFAPPASTPTNPPPLSASALVVGINPQQHSGTFDSAGQGFAKDLGVHSIRIGYQHGDHDAGVAWAAQNGVGVLFMLGYSRGCNPTNAAGRQCYADRSASLAQKYGNKVQYYEIWNEWNGGFGLDCHWGQAGTPCTDGVMYTDLLCRTYKAVKAVQPNAKIVGGATAGVDTGFISKMLDAGAGSCMDMVSVHPYVFSQTKFSVPVNSSPKAGVDKFIEAITAVNNLVKQKTGRSIPIAVTEDGRSDFGNASNEQGVSAYITELFGRAKTIPFLDGIWWYELEDIASHAPGLGLVRSNNSKKPAYFAFQAAAKGTPPLAGNSSTPAPLSSFDLLKRNLASAFFFWK